MKTKITVVVIYGIIGAALGLVIGLMLSYPGLKEAALNPTAVFWAGAVLSVSLQLWLFIQVISGRSRVKKYEVSGTGPDFERSISNMLILSSFVWIFIIGWICVFYISAASAGSGMHFVSGSEIVFLIFPAVSIIITSFIQSALLNIYNLVFKDRKYNSNTEEYFKSLDEGEKWVVYRSSWKAFKTTDRILLVSVLVYFIYALVFSTTYMPVVVLSIIWACHKGMYYYEANKYDPAGEKEKEQV